MTSDFHFEPLAPEEPNKYEEVTIIEGHTHVKSGSVQSYQLGVSKIMDFTQPTVKELLTQLMIKRGLTQTQTANLLGTSQANISRWLKTDLKGTSMFSKLLRQTLTNLINMK